MFLFLFIDKLKYLVVMILYICSRSLFHENNWNNILSSVEKYSIYVINTSKRKIEFRPEYQLYSLYYFSLYNNNSNKMGNENSDAATAASLRNFPMQKYLNQGLNQQQILKIKEAFDAYHPVNG